MFCLAICHLETFHHSPFRQISLMSWGALEPDCRNSSKTIVSGISSHSGGKPVYCYKIVGVQPSGALEKLKSPDPVITGGQAEPGDDHSVDGGLVLELLRGEQIAPADWVLDTFIAN